MGAARGTSIGYVAVAAAALLWATSGVCAKELFRGGVTPVELVQFRLTLASGLLAAVLLCFSPRLLRVRRADLALFAGLGALMIGVQVTYFEAIRLIQVAAAILLQYMAPILVAAFAMTFWREKVTAVKVLSLVLAVAGCYLVAGGYDLAFVRMNQRGIVAGLASAALFAAASLITERALHRHSPWTVLLGTLGFAALLLNLRAPLSFLRSAHSGGEWLAAVYVGVAGTLLPFGLYYVGINHVRATRASITATLEPVLAGAFAFVWLGEALELWQILGGLAVIAAIVLLQRGKEEDALAPAEVRARLRPEGSRDGY